MKKILKRILTLCLLAAVLLAALTMVSCSDGDEEEVPDRMQLATLPGCPYRLFIPTDWTPLTATGISGGYYSMNDHVTATVNSYDAPAYVAESTTETVVENMTRYATEIHIPTLAEVYHSTALTFSDPTPAKLGGEKGVSFTIEGTVANESYRGTEVLCLHGGRVYVLSFTAKSDPYDSVVETLTAIWDSFRFSEKPAPGESVNTVDPDADAPEGMMLASNNDVAYRFYVPATWKLDTTQPTSSAYVSEEDRSNVTVTVYMPDRDDYTAQTYWEMCEFQIRSALPTMTAPEITEDGAVTLDTRPAYTSVYSAQLNGKEYRFAQTYANYRGMFYTITYTAEASRFDDHLDEYNRILAAFDFRGN